jgi:hypothetical protein
MSTTTDDSDDNTSTLGSRENWWGQQNDDDPDQPSGHVECSGTDPAEHTAHELILRVTQPICGTTGEPLSDPAFYLPKQVEISDGQYIEYRNHRLRRRYEAESGRINWGESTSTDVPEIGYEAYQLLVATYLVERGYRLTEEDDYLDHAEACWHDPQWNSKQSLTQLIEYVRDAEED